jgi:hypothetical protein
LIVKPFDKVGVLDKIIYDDAKTPSHWFTLSDDVEDESSIEGTKTPPFGAVLGSEFESEKEHDC